MSSRKMMSSSRVAKMLSVHINTVRRWSDRGILKGYRIGPRGDRRFAQQDIDELLESRRFGETDLERSKESRV